MNEINKVVYSKLLNELCPAQTAGYSSEPVPEEKVINLLDIDVNGLNKKSKKYNIVKNLVITASVLAAAPVAIATGTAQRQDNPTTPSTPAAKVTNTEVDVTGVIVDTNFTKNTQVSLDNGVAVVDIANPDANGVSDNRFSSFSTQAGVVFKNNRIELRSGLLSKKLAANKNLEKAAKAILAQVTGNNKSVIKGTLEVLGEKADLLVINPNGIDLNGIKLLNVNDFTASTANVNANNYAQQTVEKGTITVGGDLTTDDVNMIRLIAQAVQVKAKIAPSKKYKGKKADIVVSAGKQNFNLATNTATALDNAEQETKVAISGDSLGSMYGNKVNFIVSGSGVGVDYDGLVVGDDNIEITADGKVKVGHLVSKQEVAVTSKNNDVELAVNPVTKAHQPDVEVDSTLVSKADYLNSFAAGKKVSLAGKNVKVSKGSKVLAQQVSLAAQEKVNVAGNVKALDKLTLAAQTAEAVEVESTGSLTAKKAAADLAEFQNLNVSNLQKAEQFFSKVTNTVDNTLVTTTVTVNKGETFKTNVVNNFVVKNKFDNFGIVNLKNTNPSNHVRTEAGVLISTGEAFNNYGLLVADKLALTSVKEINLAGSTFVYNDASFVAPVVNQTGKVTVEQNLTVKADSYKVHGTVNGELAVKSAGSKQSSHYADHSLRRDLYEITTEFGQVDASNVNVTGGELTVKGNLQVNKLDADNTNSKLLDAINAEIYVGKDLTINGNAYNSVETLEVKVVDLLKHPSSKIEFKFQPRTWINTGLMRTKVQTFNSMYDLFQAVFNNTSGFSRYNGAYRIRDDYFFDTLKEGIKDSYSNKVFATVFGADWRQVNYSTLAQRWNDFLAKQEQVTVNLFAPGAQIIVGGNYTQTNGDLYVGTDESFVQQAEQELKNRDFTFKVNRAELATDKITRKVVEHAELDAELTQGANQAVSSINQDRFKNIAKFSDILEEGQELAADDITIASQLIDQIKAQTGNFLLSEKSESELINTLITNIKIYKTKKAEIDQWLADKLRIASSTGRQIYLSQYDKKIARLNRNYDKVEVVPAANGKVTLNLVLSERTEKRIQKLAKAAASINSGNTLSVQNAGTVQNNLGLLRAETVNLQAQNVALNANNQANSVEANATNVQATNVVFTGSAEVGDLNVTATNVKFASRAELNDEGYLVQTGTLNAKNANVSASHLEFDAFKFIADESANLEAGSINLFAKHEVLSTFDKYKVKKAIGTGQTKKAVYGAAGSEVKAQDLNVTVKAGDLNLQSSKLAADNNLSVTITAGNLDNSALTKTTITENHEEIISLNGNAGVSFAGYEASVKAELATNEGDIATSTVAQHTNQGKNSPFLGLNFSYKTKDSNKEEVAHENSQINAQNAKVVVNGTAEIGNLDFNSEVKTGEDSDTEVTPSLSLKAQEITSNNKENTTKLEESSTNFEMSLGLSAGSKALDALAATVKSATSGTRNTEVDPTLALQIISEAEALIIKPIGNAQLQAKMAGGWSSAEVKASETSKNTYKGNVNLESTSALNLKAVEGSELTDLTLKAETVNIEGAVKHETVTSNSGKASASLDAGLFLDATGPRGTLGTTFGVESKWTKGESTRYQNSEINAKNVNVEATDIHVKSTTVTAENVTIKAKVLEVASQQDQENTLTGGFSVSGTGGAAISAAGIGAFGAVNAGASFHKVTENKVADQTTIKATRDFKVNADAATIEGAALVASTTSDIKISEITAKHLTNNRDSDGGVFNGGLGFNKDGITRYSIGGGRDDQEHHASVSKASIIGGKLNSNSNVNGELNQDADSITEVTKDSKVQGTTFSYHYSKGIAEKIKETGKKVLDKGKAVAEKVKPGVTNPKNPYAEGNAPAKPAAEEGKPGGGPGDEQPVSSASTETTAPATADAATTTEAPATEAASTNTEATPAAETSTNTTTNNG